MLGALILVGVARGVREVGKEAGEGGKGGREGCDGRHGRGRGDAVWTLQVMSEWRQGGRCHANTPIAHHARGVQAPPGFLNEIGDSAPEAGPCIQEVEVNRYLIRV